MSNELKIVQTAINKLFRVSILENILVISLKLELIAVGYIQGHWFTYQGGQKCRIQWPSRIRLIQLRVTEASYVFTRNGIHTLAPAYPVLYHLDKN